MRKTRLITIAMSFALAAPLGVSAGEADSGTELLKTKGCLGCHDREAKKVGPSLKDIAAKKPEKKAVVAKLKDGKGHMKVNASDAEISAMVDAVLATK
jgi:cytochrome c551/c552